MKFLIVLGLFPLFSASPYWANRFLPQPFFSGYSNYPSLYNNLGPNLYNNQGLSLQARSQTDSLVSTLRELARDPMASQAINRVFNNDAVCLNNMEEAIQAIQEGGRLVEAAEGDLRTLTSRVEGLMRLTGEAEVVREVAAIFRVLDSLLNKLNPADQTICSASSDSTSAYISSLAVMMNEFSEDFQLDPQSRDMFKETSKVLSATNAFLRNLKTQAKEFQSFCFTDKESSANGVRAMGKIITSLADLSATLGNLNAAEEIRKGNEYAEKIVVSSVKYFRFVFYFLFSRPRSRI